jgi:hypothetical protein
MAYDVAGRVSFESATMPPRNLARGELTMRSMLKTLLWIVPLMVVTGCGPSWQVVRQGPMFAPQTPFAVEPTAFNNTVVGKKTEAEWLANKPPEAQMSFQNDKAAFSARLFMTAQQFGAPLSIAGPEAMQGRFVVHSNVEYLEPGNFNGFFNIATDMRTRVVITDPAGQPVDEVLFRCVVGADIYRPSIGQRVSDCGAITGRHIAFYLRRRSGM